MTPTAPARRPSWPRFARHYGEMVVAMFAGMLVFGLLRAALGLTVGHDARPDLAYLLMACDMSLGMAAWMRFREHAWRPTLEMCAAMFVPAVPLFPLLWLDVIDGEFVMIAAHVAMFPLMLGAMLLRRDEYARC